MRGLPLFIYIGVCEKTPGGARISQATMERATNRGVGGCYKILHIQYTYKIVFSIFY